MQSKFIVLNIKGGRSYKIEPWFFQNTIIHQANIYSLDDKNGSIKPKRKGLIMDGKFYNKTPVSPSTIYSKHIHIISWTNELKMYKSIALYEWIMFKFILNSTDSIKLDETIPCSVKLTLTTAGTREGNTHILFNK